MALVGALMIYTLATRTALGVSVLHDRNPVFVRLADGALRNAYTIRIDQQDTGRPGRSALEVIGLRRVDAGGHRGAP